MENILEILKSANVELTEDQKKTVTEAVKKSYRGIEEFEDKTARYYGRDLTRNIYADGLHKKEVLRIFFESHFVHYSAGHGECRNAGCAYHRVYLVFEEKVDEFSEQNAACGIHYEGDKSESEDKKRFGCQELVVFHL